ncbi:hypothetical protein PHLCEN_2v12800 [Hermanssonia centrifuga]|nr:hypothetical protein PHLCEN_2v12800 [Hermanssonia centrifuga]
MPQILPPGPPGASGAPTPHPLAKQLQSWVKTNYDTAMKAVAFIELIIMARVFLGALTFRNSLMTPLFYAHFLRQRYYQSQFTRIAVTSVKGRAEEYVRKPGSPPILAQIWDKFTMIVERWAGSTLAPQQPAQAGGQ